MFVTSFTRQTAAPEIDKAGAGLRAVKQNHVLHPFSLLASRAASCFPTPETSRPRVHFGHRVTSAFHGSPSARISGWGFGRGPPTNRGGRAHAITLGTWLRGNGNFETAENATQEALLSAATTWPAGGRPDNPLSWLTTVASRRPTDLLRSEHARQR